MRERPSGLTFSEGFRGSLGVHEREPVELFQRYLDCLNLDLIDLAGKTSLDIGLGVGKIFEEALVCGLDFYGVDIIPAINLPREVPRGLEETVGEVRIGQEALFSLAKKNPNRIIAADAARRLPFRNNSFDFVLSCYGLPGYARDPQEAADSILEMIRVAKKKVIFSENSRNDQDQGEIAVFGFGNHYFRFALGLFLDSLKEGGIDYEQQTTVDRSRVLFKARRSFHLQVEGKNDSLLQQIYQRLIGRAEGYRRS